MTGRVVEGIVARMTLIPSLEGAGQQSFGRKGL